MKLYNSLTKKVEDIVPLKDNNVGIYSCGMTVYDYAHIGHGRKYVIDDILRRTLISRGYSVTFVQNVTDVGHLTSDADSGEDKLEKGARKQGKSVWEVAEYFTKHFYDTMQKLNVMYPDVVCKATEHINEQIALIEKILANGFAYDTPEAVYFDVTKAANYNALFGQDLAEKRVAVRDEVEEGTYKKNPQDFVLWFKRVGHFENHTMHWDSPWGDGFPGWHIECSAMSMKYLGEQFDIHTGGEDHKPIHHTNEIAQSEAASGKSPFVNYWLHTSFLTVDGVKMSKSLGNFYTIEDIEKKGIDPLALRYFYLNAHYRKKLNFTWEALEAAQTAYKRLKELSSSLVDSSSRTNLSEEKLIKIQEYQKSFWHSLEDDLNTSQALAVVWETVKSNIPETDKKDFLLQADQVLGLDLFSNVAPKQVSDELKSLIKMRDEARIEKDYEKADRIRAEIEKLGYSVLDTSEGTKVV